MRVAVVGLAHERWIEAIAAVVVARQPVSPEELIAFARERCAAHKVPKSQRRPSGFRVMTVHAIGINHIAFEVTDLDATLAFYERFFEVRLRGRRKRMAWIDLDYRDVQFSKTEAVLSSMGLRGLGKSDPARAEMRDKGLLAE